MAVAEKFVDAFNRRDVEAMTACFTPDATYHDMLYGLHDSQDGGLRKLFERFFHEGGPMTWALDHLVESPAAEMAEWTFTLTQSENAPRGVGPTIEFRGGSIWETTGGLCSAYREHFDKGTLLAKLGLDADAVYKVLMRP